MGKRNDCLNMIKGIACFFVVFMHVPFLGVFGIVVKKIGEFAVPLFFMISGFYLWKPEYDILKIGLSRKIKRMFKVCFVVFAAYFFWNMLISHFGSGHLANSAFMRRCFTIEHLYKFIFFQNTDIIGGRSPYWFLFALLLTYVILLAVFRLPKWRLIYTCLPILLLLNFYLHTTDLGWDYYNNIWTTAIPFVLIGFLIAERRLFKKITPIAMVVISVISLFVAIVGSIVHFPCPISITQFAISIFSIGIFCLSLAYPDYSISAFSNIGAKYSMLIYIFHPFVITVIEKLAEAVRIKDRMFYLWSAPIMVALISLFLSITYVVIKKFFFSAENRFATSRS